ncbi:MAG: HypC/HybG/HupF family hydrogenase formation chaperone [Azonexus sp.]|nr:HypC/HybG/HupF family hydrogenase formation chaperone [Azonexus sp.]
MCLAVPMQITHLDGYDARCSAKGVERQVSLFILQHEMPSVGDWVLIHVGYAIQVITAENARETWDLLDQLVTEDPSFA